ncbi:hypothetical protein BB560_003067 [Smittium megazygosporum]|uniref:Phenylalanine--tRNA ligase, mitochondrial n=1 Tax=Smittium megazygosporum TaxID=133381 RepID=A0A2T9ZD13_9FUNG|nr:hypothetical protein BB560_003067 [Smittium megazygosporum]
MLATFSKHSTKRLYPSRITGFYYAKKSFILQSPFSTAKTPPSIRVLNKEYRADEWTNISPSISSKLDAHTLSIPAHPTNILKQLVFSLFPTFAHYDSLSPIVSTYDNFDSLLIHKDHPSRAKSDSYYINKETLLRTHTSAHQVQLLKAGSEKNTSLLSQNKNKNLDLASGNINKRFLLAADVYRRDEIDASHYPIFHQVEAVSTFSTKNLVDEIDADTKARIDNTNKLARSLNLNLNLASTSDDLSSISKENPIQSYHDEESVILLSNHMKSTMNNLVSFILSQVPSTSNSSADAQSPLPVRWIDASFPFTSPSWEMEVWWNNQWLEICGCGIMKQDLLINSEMGDSIGWAFGFGLDRLAMILFGIPDIRLLWSNDERFISQFTPGKITQFSAFSKFSPCYKDISFWLPPESNEFSFHENDLSDLIREIAGNLVQDVKLVDSFTHPKTNLKSLCYRINYCSMDRNVTNEEINSLQNQLREKVVEKFGVALR